MADKMTIPLDAGTERRKQIDRWDRLWRGQYVYDDSKTDAVDATNKVRSAPGYSRSLCRIISGLFLRQTPTITPDPDDDGEGLALASLLAEITSKGAGYGQVLVRPISDGTGWVPSVVAPTRYVAEWAHRRLTKVRLWDVDADPRHPDVKDRHLVMIEEWTDGPDTTPGTVSTSVYEATTDPAGKMELADRPLDLDNPPAELVDHPFVVSARNDTERRDYWVFVWAWDEPGPVSLWYTNEGVLDGIARLWDQEQDDAEMTRKRVAMPADLLGRTEIRAEGTQTVIARPGWRPRDNVLLLGSSMSAQHGPDGGVTPIEFSDDLVQRERIERRENGLLEAVGISPQSIGRNVSGRSDSAAAKRADSQMTMNTITEPARNVERVLSAVTTECSRLNPGPTRTVEVVVHEGMKEDPSESVAVARALRDADAASTRTIVRTAHPTWSDTRVDEEVEAMRAEGVVAEPVEM